MDLFERSSRSISVRLTKLLGIKNIDLFLAIALLILILWNWYGWLWEAATHFLGLMLGLPIPRSRAIVDWFILPLIYVVGYFHAAIKKKIFEVQIISVSKGGIKNG